MTIKEQAFQCFLNSNLAVWSGDLRRTENQFQMKGQQEDTKHVLRLPSWDQANPTIVHDALRNKVRPIKLEYPIRIYNFLLK